MNPKLERSELADYDFSDALGLYCLAFEAQEISSPHLGSQDQPNPQDVRPLRLSFASSHFS